MLEVVVNLFGIFLVPAILGILGLYGLWNRGNNGLTVFAAMMATSNLYLIVTIVILILAGKLG